MRDTRTELLMRAETLVRGRGYAGFSYADLSEAVGIRKASIHHHFRTKEDLAVALLAAYGERYAGALEAIDAGEPNGLLRVEAYAELYLGGVEQGLGCLCAALASELHTLPERLRADLAAFFEAHIGWVEGTLRAGQADGSIRRNLDPAPYARLVIASLEGALMMERVLAGPAGFGATLRALRESLARA